MDYKEMLTKTGMAVKGISKGINEFTSKKTGVTYHSVDLEIQGCRTPVNVKLPHEYDKSKFKDYELVQLNCIVRPTYDRKNIELYALA